MLPKLNVSAEFIARNLRKSLRLRAFLLPQCKNTLMTEQISYELEAKGDLKALESAAKEIKGLSKSMDVLEKDQKSLTKSTGRAADAIDDFEKETKSLKGTLGGLMKMGVGGFFAGITGAIAGGVTGGVNFVKQVDQMASRMAIASEDASVLAVSLSRAGTSAEEAEPAFSSFQGRLIDELEAQKNVAKEVAAIEKDRQSVLADLGKMEADHMATLTSLEAERAKIGSDGVGQRLAERDKELSSLTSDHARTMDGLRDQEKKENARYAEIWQDRVKEYEKNALKLREDFEDKSRSARNYREFREAQQNYQKQQSELKGNLNEEKEKHQSAHQARLSDLESSRQRESQIFAERSAEIAQKADEDVAKLQQANAQAVADLDARIEEEKAAYHESTVAANERLGELAQAQSEAKSQGAGLTFMMKELGVEIFDADGKMRPLNDLVWDMKDSLGNMEDGARKAAIISDLGWEDIAKWVDDGTDSVDALNFAEAESLIVTEEMIAKQRKAERAFNDLILQATGVGLAIIEDSDLFATFTEIMGALSELMLALNEAGVFTAIGEGIKWMAEQITDAIDMIKGLYDVVSEFFTLAEDSSAFEIFSAFSAGVDKELLGGNLGKLGQAILPSFATGGLVPGSGPTPIMAHGGEMVIPREQMAQLRSGGSSSPTFNFNAPIYGVNDLQATIQGALRQVDNGALSMGVR